MNGPHWRTFHDHDLALIQPDREMAAQLDAHGGELPRGPAWTWRDGGRVLAIAGYRREGASEGMGWLLAAEMTPRQWVRMIAASESLLLIIRGWRTVRTLHALADVRIKGARRALERLGFRAGAAAPARFEDAGPGELMTLELF